MFNYQKAKDIAGLHDPFKDQYMNGKSNYK